MKSVLPNAVNIVEVGPRDGLQNESIFIDTATKINLINQLSATGLKYIESTSFVSPKWVPQMADAEQVLQGITPYPNVVYSALTPNLKGLENALNVKVKEVAIFGAASETFSQKNINCSIQESLQRFVPVLEKAQQHGVRVRGYLSCVIGCPYEGKIAPEKVADLTQQLLDMGCYQVSLGDTIGVGTPRQVHELLDQIERTTQLDRLAVHFHDTYGQAIANIYAALEHHITTIDCAIAGLGGCPYAKGASGNVATEDVIYLLNGLGIAHPVNLSKLIEVSQFISQVLKRSPNSKVAKALASNSCYQ